MKLVARLLSACCQLSGFLVCTYVSSYFKLLDWLGNYSVCSIMYEDRFAIWLGAIMDEFGIKVIAVKYCGTNQKYLKVTN